MKCPKCGSQLDEKQDGSSSVVRCVNCGYSVATTSISQIYEDETEYSIILQKNNRINKDTIMLLMNVAGLNISMAADIMKNKCPYELFNGKAVEIKEISEKLKDKGIIYEIVPKFPW